MCVIIFDRPEAHARRSQHGCRQRRLQFHGSAVEVGETVQEALSRELQEEIDAGMTAARYLFVVENFTPSGVEARHALKHYFEVDLDRERVAPTRDGVAFHWTAIDEVGGIDLRPFVVGDSISDGAPMV
ncbi:MAG: NUDIX domain-containing protein [Candidatus Promineifilaceae bacterium]|nr:NUDIX domain-containing protein [Candidatus Promineifilaceae bacterium]